MAEQLDASITSKTHKVVIDLIGSRASPLARISCMTCNSTIVRQSDTPKEEWALKRETFHAEHPCVFPDNHGYRE